MKFLGHPAHPMLVAFPLGLLITAAGFDAIYLLWGQASFATAAFYMMVVGVVMGVLAEITGLLDWFYIRKGSRAQRIGVWHGLGNFFAILFFGISTTLRGSTLGFIPTGSAPWWSFAGAAILLVTGWLGGELVFQLGEAVDKQAHANAPNSLKS